HIFLIPSPLRSVRYELGLILFQPFLYRDTDDNSAFVGFLSIQFHYISYISLSFFAQNSYLSFPRPVLHKFRFIMVYLRTEYGMICAFASLSPSITFKTPFKRILRIIDATHSLTSFSSPFCVMYS